MGRGTGGSPAVTCGLVLLILTPFAAMAGAVSGSAYFRDGPPARLTGGFGEESCFACHWGGEENDGVGSLTLSGIPERYTPGERYPVEVTLVRPGMVVGGFQLAARFATDTTQAGTFIVSEGEKTRVALLSERDIEFAHHTLAGLELTAPDTARWIVLWEAPAREGVVYFHASSVAGDDDESQIGDHTYTTERRTRR